MNATNRRTLAALGCLLLGLSLCLARAEDKGKADADIVQSVWSRLIAVAEPVAGLEWPPPCTLEKDNAINAFATALRIRKPASEGKQPANGSWAISPRVVVFSGMMTNVIRTSGDKDADAAADRLAYILGHELSHITLGHVTSPREGETSLARQVFSREQEIAADVRGAELALKAGFSLRRGLDSIRRMQKLGLEYSSFEGLHAGHPSWNDRLVHLDKEQAGLWKTMSAFQNGAFFLMTEQFASAEVCFRAVTREFPNCHEAWANLGYALLMQYCDGLDTEDVRRFGIGQIAIGGFYRRPKSLEPETRGIQTKVWQEAVTCLQKSLQLKNSQSIAKAHLGVAYLVHPDGKPDLARASLYLNQAVITDKVAARLTREIDSLAIAAISVNAGVADLAAGRNEAAAQKFDDGEKFGGLPFGTYDGPSVRSSVVSALAYNRAVLFAGGGPEKQAEAAQLFEAYLELTGSGGAWWPLAYEKYVAICKKLGRELRPKDDLAGQTVTRRRMITSVRLADGTTLTVSEPVTDAAERLGEKIPIVSRTKLARWHCPKHGVDVLATDRILAIHLVGDRPPPVVLRDAGIAGKAVELRLNMPEGELKQILGDEICDDRPLDDPKVLCRFYPRVGVALRIKDGKVSDLAVTQIPRRQPGE